MDRRLILFFLCSFTILFLYSSFVLPVLYPPQDKPKDAQQAKQAAKKGDGAKKDEADPNNKQAKDETGKDQPTIGDDSNSGKDSKENESANESQKETKASPKPHPLRRLVLGSLDPQRKYRGLWTFSSQGAAVERMELCPYYDGHTYFDLEDKWGYLGHLALANAPKIAGCEVHIVGNGTPAQIAGIQAGDIIQQFNEQPVDQKVDLARLLRETKPGDQVKIRVLRDGKPQEFSAKLTRRPVEIIRPEPAGVVQPVEPPIIEEYSPLSCRLTLSELNGKKLSARTADQFRRARWRVVKDGSDGQTVEFRLKLSQANLEGIDLEEGEDLEFVRRYEIARRGTSEKENGDQREAFHLVMSIEIHNLGAEPHKVAYQLEGPNGLPWEGWWYAYKVHRGWFKAAGARDVAWSTHSSGPSMLSPSNIYKTATSGDEASAGNILFDRTQQVEQRDLNYVGVDTLYFACMYLPIDPDAEAESFVWSDLQAKVASQYDKEVEGRLRTKVNVSFELTSETQTIQPNQPLVRKMLVFAGPKDPQVLAGYGLETIIYHGWFGWISTKLLWILNSFYSLIPLYGLAIIFLTVLVRGCMFPLSRKAALNAQMMQALAPEMKQLAEKYKNDLQKRSEAQRALFAKYNYNPLGGCWMMFLQLPIFLGLYRGLAVDIHLRDAPLIPGLGWCSNLAAPDMLLYWRDAFFLPGFLVDYTGYLGPYLNVLPLVTVVLFLVQQKLFAPPATDEQTRLQLKIMNFMTILIGVMFFKVPAGLCIYFITSSLWGIAERKLLPKKGKPEDMLKKREEKAAQKRDGSASSPKKPRVNPWGWANGAQHSKTQTRPASKTGGRSPVKKASKTAASGKRRPKQKRR